jgi:hypothetical protein
MKLVHAERNGEAFDSQLVIGVRESYVNLSSNASDKLQVDFKIRWMCLQIVTRGHIQGPDILGLTVGYSQVGLSAS